MSEFRAYLICSGVYGYICHDDLIDEMGYVAPIVIRPFRKQPVIFARIFCLSGAHVINFFWIPGRGRFAPLPGMTGFRKIRKFSLYYQIELIR